MLVAYVIVLVMHGHTNIKSYRTQNIDVPVWIKEWRDEKETEIRTGRQTQKAAESIHKDENS